jgi:pimeloyl-ACP methyl ester carboxylesterase
LSLIGHSSGGATAFAFACRYPDRVARAVLIEPTLYPLLPPADLAPIVEAIDALAAAAAAEGPAVALRLMLESVAGEAWTGLDAETKRQRLERMAPIAPLVVPHVQGLRDAAVSEADMRDLRPPTLLFYGTRSFPFESVIAARFRALRPDLRVITAENAGHNVHRDHAELFNPEALAFLAG